MPATIVKLEAALAALIADRDKLDEERDVLQQRINTAREVLRLAVLREKNTAAQRKLVQQAERRRR
jgi:hypothetical protein